MDRAQLLLTLAILMALLFALERFAPLRTPRRPLLGRLLVNLLVSGSAFLTANVLVRPAVLATLRWTSDRPFGLAHVVALPVPAEWLLSFLLLDLTFYWWHRANHELPFLWRFHNVHHIDPDLDVSTAFRFHFGEVAFSTVFRAVQIGLLGVSAPVFAAYELVFQANTLIHHSNVRWPLGVERLVNLVLVTPRMHGIHHSQAREETNSNYSVVFAWWDRLHRTRRADLGKPGIVIGVPAYSNPEDNTVTSALILPFRPQRAYWGVRAS